MGISRFYTVLWNMAHIPTSARRTFNDLAAKRRAEVRDEVKEEKPLTHLKAHQSVPSFDRFVGQTQVVGARGAGFYCRECDTLHKDSNRYLAHINGRAHLAKIGMSTRARRATVEEVRQAFEVERRRANGDDEPPPVVESKDEVVLTKEQQIRADLGLPTEFGSGK